MNRQTEMFVRKDYSIIALAESLKRGGDQRKARFERSLSGMTLELMPTADRGPGEAIPSVSFARDLELGSQAGGQAIVSSSVLPVAAATRPQTILEAGGATVIDLNTTSGTNLPMFCCKGRLMAKIYEQRFTFHLIILAELEAILNMVKFNFIYSDGFNKGDYSILSI